MRIEIHKELFELRDDKQVHCVFRLYKTGKRQARGLTKKEASFIAKILLEYSDNWK